MSPPLEPEDILHDPEPLDEDLYGVSVASLLRDSRRVARGEQVALRIGRIAAVAFLLLGMITAQLFLVLQFRRLVTEPAVRHIRSVYDEYEVTMYGNWTWINVNGKHRGIDGHFNAKRFAELSSSAKSTICQLPLSQPTFLGIILAIWSFTVVIYIRKILYLTDLLLIRTPSNGVTLDNMLAGREDGRHEVVLEGLPLWLKAVLFNFLLLPRLLLNVILCWLGCRWLTATSDFTELLLNAMGLEFILLMKDLVYIAVVPLRDKFDTRTLLVPMRRRLKPNCCVFLGSFGWAAVIVLWVFLYMRYLQEVLPGYKFDVHKMCDNHLREVL